MKKRLLMLLASVAMVAALTACGGKDEPTEEVTVEFEEEAEEVAEEEPVVEEVVVPEGFYRSELTNEVISEELKDQRPIAVMVDNDKRALPHYGLTKADVVYELMNSTHNKEVTRFMCLVKDWAAIEQFGSVRSYVLQTFFLQMNGMRSFVMMEVHSISMIILHYLHQITFQDISDV